MGPLDVVDDHSVDDVEAARHETVWRLRHDLAQDASATEFEVALESLLERLALVRVELS